MSLSPIEIRAAMTVALLIMLALAAREDLLRHRVPNVLNASALAMGVALAFVAGGWDGFLDSLGGALVGCAALLPFYLLRGMGAGDVKLMAAAGAYLEPGSALLAAAIALVAGCVLALAIIVCRLVEPVTPYASAGPSGTTPMWRAAAALLTVRQERFPYAVAVGFGVVVTLGLQGQLGNVFTALGGG
jgi:prepilin peptidase CpaA